MTNRTQFETRYPVPEGVTWNESLGMYEVTDIWKLEKPITIGRYNWLWEGWQASRDSLVIDLGDMEWLHHDEVRDTLEQSGLKVRP
jgi:hypothetical protein